MRLGWNPAYFTTRFRTQRAVFDWPPVFGIVSAYATTGEVWTSARNEAADWALDNVLRAHGVWLQGIVGYAPGSSGHAEPRRAAEHPVAVGRALSARFLQDVVLLIQDDLLSATSCDRTREGVGFGPFRARLDVNSLKGGVYGEG